MHTGPFRSGTQVPTTGVYTATHYRHRLPHDVLVVAGDLFPECRRCGQRVSFSMSQAIISIDADRDFCASPESVDLPDIKHKPVGDL